MLLKEELLEMVKLAQQTERYIDQVDYMTQLVQRDFVLIKEEINLLASAYKNAVYSTRLPFRIIQGIAVKEQYKGSKYIHLINDYQNRILQERNSYCNDLITLIDNHILGKSNDLAYNVFFYKMKGDYHRKLLDYGNILEHKEWALNAYMKAIDLACSKQSSFNSIQMQSQSKETIKQNPQQMQIQGLKASNPIRLGLVLNYCDFLFESLNEPEKALSFAKQAFDDAMKELDQITPDDEQKDATLILQLLRDNMILWTYEMNEQEQEQ